MLKRLIVKGVAKIARKLSAIGLSKNEHINIKGYRYPVADLIGYSEEKLEATLASHGLTGDELKLAKDFVRGLGGDNE